MQQATRIPTIGKFLKLTLIICFLAVQFPVWSQSIRIDLPKPNGLISMVGNDRYLLTDDEEYFLLERRNNPSLLFEIKTGKMKAIGAEAYKIYTEHTKAYPNPNYNFKENEREFTMFEDNKKLYSIKIDRDKNEVRALDYTGIALEYHKQKQKLFFVHPDGKKVELASKYSNLDKKDPKRNLHHRSAYSNLEIGYYFMTKDRQYLFDRDGRIINLLTGEAMKVFHDAGSANGSVYGNYDPETSILKINQGGDVKAYHLRTSYELGTVDYDYYLNGKFTWAVSIPMLRSNSQLCVIGLGFSEAAVCLISDNKPVHYFINPNAESEKKDYALWRQKRNEENQERLRQEEAQRQWYRDNPIKGVSLVTCKDCNGTGMLGRTAETKANQVNVYEKRNGNYYFKGTSHDTWPIICGKCWGRGSIKQ
ncbi:hypothetical protein [Pedobacter flavus]|uniref:WG repeat-containing protein n=1 Tax=Pedobacter flavus TaxID=3113906 RepID=A0ABU7GYR9_9SPHI|nr:hypothetical protein [Pedobacter sp. VNH31]MEE1884209.1 hypothetical protein [Pedobacter sp. VNH31]